LHGGSLAEPVRPGECFSARRTGRGAAPRFPQSLSGIRVVARCTTAVRPESLRSGSHRRRASRTRWAAAPEAAPVAVYGAIRPRPGGPALSGGLARPPLTGRPHAPRPLGERAAVRAAAPAAPVRPAGALRGAGATRGPAR